MKTLKKIVINIIPHNEQRYDTLGDWFPITKGVLKINVSKFNDSRYAYLVAVHELLEAGLCEQKGNSEESVREFDLKFKGKGEPGDSVDAPYHDYHWFSTRVEMALANELKVDWEEYNESDPL